MDRKQFAASLKNLRKERGVTQETAAEVFGVSNRTVSRWETGANLPDLEMLVQMADYYDVDLKTLIDGERRTEVNEELKETVMTMADYSNEEKIRLMSRLHVLAWAGVLSSVLWFVLTYAGVAETETTRAIASFCAGLSCGMLVLTVLFTSRHIMKLRKLKTKWMRAKER